MPQREIKFRAWNKNVGTMTTSIWPSLSQFKSEDKEHVFMQFTGLLDKNGKEIFEGDIVRYFVNGMEIIDKVIWIMGFFAVSKYCGQIISFNPIEVIGNIYENPGLLK